MVRFWLKHHVTGDAVVVADIDASTANDKRRPDGTDIFADRRPELYQAIGLEPADLGYPVGAEKLATAVYQSHADGADALEECADAVARATRQGVQLIVLPELFCFDGGVVDDVDTAVVRSQQAVATLSAALKATGRGAYVVTSIVESVNSGHSHVGVLIGGDGVVQKQPQLHRSARHADWVTNLGKALNIMQMPWGRLAIIVGDDAIYPETFRLASLQGADVVAAPIHVLEKWEVELGLLERSAENRICLIAASRATDAGS